MSALHVLCSCGGLRPMGRQSCSMFCVKLNIAGRKNPSLVFRISFGNVQSGCI